jgi:hypothetical protein
MRMRAAKIVTFLFFSAALGLPVALRAAENSVFNGPALIGGSALYLDTSGDGALVGAPLPVSMCGENRMR